MATALLAGCAAPPGVEVLLLPQPDGRPSAVQVSTGGVSEKLAAPYQRLVAHAGQPVRVDQASADEVARRFPALFALRPPQPQRFVLYFATGDAGLTPASEDAVQQLLAAASQYPGADIVVTGHTDTRGSAESNDALSLARARQVRTLLLQSQVFTLQPVPAERIAVVGRGERELAVPTGDEVDEPRNRRVEVWLR